MLIVISLIIIGSIGIHFFTNNKSNTDFNVLDDLSNLKNEKSTILKSENNKFYDYESNNEQYIVFKIRESTYKSSIDIKSVKLTNCNYNGKILNVELKIDVKEFQKSAREKYSFLNPFNQTKPLKNYLNLYKEKTKK